MKKTGKYRFIGDTKEQSFYGIYWEFFVVEGKTIEQWATEYPDDWEEVIEPEMNYDTIKPDEAMKNEDIKKLQEMGYEVHPFMSFNDVFIIKKDPSWEGVEFVEYLGRPAWPGHYRSGFKVTSIGDTINVIDGSEKGGHLLKENCKPITEAEYIEQLKKEAIKRLGGIKLGDMFEEPNGNKYNPSLVSGKWFYNKKIDHLKYCDLSVYQSGKWATRLPKRVKVKADTFFDCLQHTPLHVFAFEIDNLTDGYSVAQVSEFLAKQLEMFLNNETQK